MAKIKGICKNYDGCDLATDKKVQEAEKSNFICAECSKPLFEVKQTPAPAPAPPYLKILLGILLCIGLAGVCWVVKDHFIPKEVETSGGTAGGHDKPGKKEPLELQIPVMEPGATPDEVVTRDVGYAVWTGRVKDSLMHDTQGTLTFKQCRIIEPRDGKKRVAQPGDKVIGTFEKGHLIQGRWYKKDGNVESIILGASAADEE